jgi:hypothetical protein
VTSPYRLFFLLFAGLLAAKEPLDICGTWFGRVQQEAFLHRRHLLERLNRPEPLAHTTTSAPPFSRDFGNVAVIDDSGGVIGRRNVFDLDRRTVAFAPASSGYTIEVGEDTFDPAASQSGVRLDLADDDTRRIELPFAFRFFGTPHREAWVNSNGTLTFTKGDTDYSGSYGHFVAGPPAIAGCFTDLDPAPSAGGVRVLAEPARVVITWASVPLADSIAFASPRNQNFQIRLYPSGRIELAWRSTNPPAALVGITPGNFRAVDLLHFSSAGAGVFAGGIAETFDSVDSVDIVFAAQRFYQTHDDSYDYLVFYNAAGVAASPGVVAFEVTTRSSGEGYGDTPVEIGAEFGSKRRLQAVLNMGPLSQYPVNPNGIVPARGPIGDTPLTLLGHEAGHLFLALVSVPDPNDPTARPMLGAGRAHWSFPFNSEASFLGGERIEDRGPGVVPRFFTRATVERYSPLDQYLMGFRPPEEVPPTFVVLNSGQALTRTPQVGVGFNGNRLDVAAADIIRVAGRRTPDSTVAQRRFRLAFVLIVPAGAAPSNAAIAQVETYRREFESFFAKASDERAIAETSLKRSVNLSLGPAAGVLEGADGSAFLEIAEPAPAPLTFTLRKSNYALLTPVFATIPAGATRVAFPVFGARQGVQELLAEPSDPAYETAAARVQVNSRSNLRPAVVTADPLVIQVEDQNKLVYSGVRVNVVSSPTTRSVALEGGGPAPVIYEGGVVDAFSYRPQLRRGGYISVFGEHLAGARLRIGSTRIVPIYTSPGQVNFLAPANLSPGAAHLILETSTGLAIARIEL